MSTRALHKPSWWLLIVLWLLTSSTAFADTYTLVLVAGEAAPAPELSGKEIRWLFMGLPVVKDEQRIEPLLNATNPLIYEVFLQKVIYMSAQNYERRLVTRVFRMGGQRPKKYDNLSDLLGNLRENPNTVSFMWQDNAQRQSNIKIVAELWSGKID